MIILPAIDIKNGECVRLLKGDFSTAHIVAEDPLQTALSFKDSGALNLHMVDLDGALNAEPANLELIVNTAKNSGLLTEVGGGIRSIKTIEKYLSSGIERVILGSAALKDKNLVKEAILKYGEKIAIGIDAKNENVMAEGWIDSANINYIEFAKEMEQLGAKYIIFTDISKDGTLKGPNIDQLQKLKQAVRVNIIASGGICNIDDIKNLKAINMYGAICGKSLYSKTLNLREAVELCLQSE